LLYHWPRGLQPAVNHLQIAQLLDQMPTILSLCHIDIPAGVQGSDLSPALREPSRVVGDNAAFIETNNLEIGIRTPTHMLGLLLDEDRRTIRNQTYCFYDMQTDPYQQHNLFREAECPSVAIELRSKLRRWHENTPWLPIPPR
jgi:arylsulfatase A-like enzyme